MNTRDPFYRDAQSNNGMHPTADTRDVINNRGAGRRVIGGVRLLRYFKSLTETCGWPGRAALPRFNARFSSGAALRVLRRGASREMQGSE